MNDPVIVHNQSTIMNMLILSRYNDEYECYYQNAKSSFSIFITDRSTLITLHAMSINFYYLTENSK